MTTIRLRVLQIILPTFRILYYLSTELNSADILNHATKNDQLSTLLKCNASIKVTSFLGTLFIFPF